MNNSYKQVWSTVQQAWVVASELAKGRQKSSGRAVVVMCSILVAPAVLAAPGSLDLPQLSGISSGVATLSNPVAGQLVVNQSTASLIANWSSFDVGQQARVDFVQPDSQSIALNRIGSAQASQIFGQVNANGQLILVNPAGLVFGAQSQVSAASIIASTYGISNANFNSSTWLFDRNGSTAAIDNQGQLTASTGNVVLLANQIQNSGTILSQQGNISLVNANQASVGSSQVQVDMPSDVAGLIQNSGTLSANRIASNKGHIYLLGNRSRAASSVVLGGTLDAKSSVVRGRQININQNLILKGNSVLDAVSSIQVNAVIDARSNRRLLALSSGTGAGEGVQFGTAGKINLSGLNMAYRENGQYYQIIRTLDELQAIDNGDIGNIDFTALAGHYVLGADIDASATSSWNYGAGFSPLGGNGSGIAFTGSFNGLGHQISNLHIYRPEFDERSSQGGVVYPDPYGFTGYNIGLFALAQNATLKNIRLTNVNIVGYENVGGLVGQNITTAGGQSVVENNQVTGTIRGAYTAEEVCISYECEAEGAPFDGYAFTGGQSVGGLIGFNQVSGHSLVQGNSSNVDVMGNVNIGGLLGNQVTNSLASSTVQRNSSMGEVSANGGAGGLIGRDTARQQGRSLIQMNHADTAMTGSIYQLSNYAGGLLGFVDAASGGITTISNNYASGSISGAGYLGGLLGSVSSNAAQVSVLHNYATGSVVGKNILGGLVGYNSVRNGSIIIRDTYASGQVRSTSSGNLTGGLVGANSIFRDGSLPASIRLSNSYWDADTTGQVQAVGNTAGTRINLHAVSGAGGSYPSAYAAASYGNFNFETIWLINEGSSRPVLQAFLNAD